MNLDPRIAVRKMRDLRSDKRRGHRARNLTQARRLQRQLRGKAN
jgi:hypothetical protein